ncbi:hypothetical protein EJ06DRAFT_532529 [Trichodelitschia bisporula]|uniref:Uncharacterized protein n=1 Tax=Trichodelitschia bisporula TaxID=703511 RepID=A0A6G1HQN8_9PEZI|nr:hypothetical protein EJ06DRAFT_532529 [Trichodelitschia bisporula]
MGSLTPETSSRPASAAARMSGGSTAPSSTRCSAASVGLVPPAVSGLRVVSPGPGPGPPLTQFQRLVRRMPAASARVMRERLREEWDEEGEEEMVEKHLWALAGLGGRVLDDYCFERSEGQWGDLGGEGGKVVVGGSVGE